jgi:hypothetical protein
MWIKAFTKLVHNTESELRFGMPLIRGSLEPFSRCYKILANVVAYAVSDTKQELGVCVSALSTIEELTVVLFAHVHLPNPPHPTLMHFLAGPRPASPIFRKFEISLHTLAECVDAREAHHGECESMLGSCGTACAPVESRDICRRDRPKALMVACPPGGQAELFERDQVLSSCHR